MKNRYPRLLAIAVATGVGCAFATACGTAVPSGGAEAAAPLPSHPDSLRSEVASERNARLRSLAEDPAGDDSRDYVIGAEDLLEVQVFSAEDLSGTVRVSSSGEISLPLLDPVQAGGRTPHALEKEVEDRLRRTYMRDPRVSVQVVEMRSRSVSVVGAVNRPGVHQIGGAARLLDVLAAAEGLSEDAGEHVMVVRRGAGDAAAASKAAGSAPLDSDHGDGDDGDGEGAVPASASDDIEEIDLRALLESGDPRYNVRIQPGDVVQVRSAGVVYVVGDVRRPGGFPLDRNEPLSVLQALALAEGLEPTAAGGGTMILRSGEQGREEIPVDLERVLSGADDDPLLHARDILFIPNSTTKSIARGLLDAFVRMATLRGLIY